LGQAFGLLSIVSMRWIVLKKSGTPMSAKESASKARPVQACVPDMKVPKQECCAK